MQTTGKHTEKDIFHSLKNQGKSLLALSFMAISGLSMTASKQEPIQIIASQQIGSSVNRVENLIPLHKYNDYIIIDLGKEILPGETYQVCWKKAQINSCESSVKLELRESRTVSNFVKNSKHYLTKDTDIQNSMFIAESVIRYVMVSVASPMNSAIDFISADIPNRDKVVKTEKSAAIKSPSLTSFSFEQNKIESNPSSEEEINHKSIHNYKFIKINSAKEEKSLLRRNDKIYECTSNFLCSFMCSSGYELDFILEIRPPPS